MVWVPLVMLAIPSAFIGFLTIEPMLYGEFFKGAIFFDNTFAKLAQIHRFELGVQCGSILMKSRNANSNQCMPSTPQCPVYP